MPIAGVVFLDDSDGTELQSLTVTLSARPDGSRESLDVLGTVSERLTMAPYDPSTGKLIVSGSAPLADYAAVIEQLVYRNQASENPTDGVRSIVVEVSDGEDTTSALSTVTVDFVNPPQLDLDTTQAPPGFEATFVAGGGAIAITSTNVGISDLDDSQLESATLTLTTRPDGACARSDSTASRMC